MHMGIQQDNITPSTQVKFHEVKNRRWIPLHYESRDETGNRLLISKINEEVYFVADSILKSQSQSESINHLQILFQWVALAFFLFGGGGGWEYVQQKRKDRQEW